MSQSKIEKLKVSITLRYKEMQKSTKKLSNDLEKYFNHFVDTLNVTDQAILNVDKNIGRKMKSYQLHWNKVQEHVEKMTLDISVSELENQCKGFLDSLQLVGKCLDEEYLDYKYNLFRQSRENEFHIDSHGKNFTKAGIFNDLMAIPLKFRLFFTELIKDYEKLLILEENINNKEIIEQRIKILKDSLETIKNVVMGINQSINKNNDKHAETKFSPSLLNCTIDVTGSDTTQVKLLVSVYNKSKSGKNYKLKATRLNNGKTILSFSPVSKKLGFFEKLFRKSPEKISFKNFKDEFSMKLLIDIVRLGSINIRDIRMQSLDKYLNLPRSTSSKKVEQHKIIVDTLTEVEGSCLRQAFGLGVLRPLKRNSDKKACNDNSQKPTIDDGPNSLPETVGKYEQIKFSPSLLNCTIDVTGSNKTQVKHLLSVYNQSKSGKSYKLKATRLNNGKTILSFSPVSKKLGFFEKLFRKSPEKISFKNFKEEFSMKLLKDIKDLGSISIQDIRMQSLDKYLNSPRPKSLARRKKHSTIIDALIEVEGSFLQEAAVKGLLEPFNKKSSYHNVVNKFGNIPSLDKESEKVDKLENVNPPAPKISVEKCRNNEETKIVTNNIDLPPPFSSIKL